MVQLALGAVLVTISELLLKKGASAAHASHGSDWTGLTALTSAWVWGGVGCYIASFVSWLYVLRHVPLILAFNLMNSVHVLVPMASLAVLGESVPGMRWGGIVLICAGICLLAEPLSKLEEKL